jgi:tRNA-specific 2-thiouridylase
VVGAHDGAYAFTSVSVAGCASTGPAADGARATSSTSRRYGEAVDCVASCDGERLHVELRRPFRGVATGQAVVLYDGDAVLGSATITSTV